MFLNLIISKSAAKYHNSSTMANGIVRAHKLGKQNKKRPVSTTDPSNESSANSKHHEMLNENPDITNK